MGGDPTQAKGILPTGSYGRVIRNPASTGHFISIKLAPGLTPDLVSARLRDTIQPLIDQLTAKIPEHGATAAELEMGEPGDRIATVAFGFGKTFFERPEIVGHVQTPWFFAAENFPASMRQDDTAADLLLYVMSLSDERVAKLLEGLWASHPGTVQSVDVDRGYQRSDGTEVFGYRDGLRNVPAPERADVVFVQKGAQVGEPAGAVDGSYMVSMRIRQNADAFNALDATARDQVIGRSKDGQRLDLAGQALDPHAEPDMTGAIPAAAHVRKAGPRGTHDKVRIFRRGLPFVDAAGGEVDRGLNFASFQASLDQFDVVFGDWMMNPAFPSHIDGSASGVDQLMDPGRGFTTILKTGYFFVPPQDGAFPGASLFEAAHEPHGKLGSIAVHKRVVDPSDASKRFDRSGFGLQVFDAAGTTPIGAPQVTDEQGHAVFVDVPRGATYLVREVTTKTGFSPTTDTPADLRGGDIAVVITNTAQQNTGYNG